MLVGVFALFDLLACALLRGVVLPHSTIMEEMVRYGAGPVYTVATK